MDWEPAPAINRTDADISLFFLSANAVVYLGQVDDPFFGAHKPTELDRGDQAYLPDRPVQMIGCADQHQFCNPNRGRDGQGRYQRCSPLTGGYVLHDVVHSGSLGFSPAQDAVSHRFLNAFPLTQIGQSVLGRGASALLASRTVSEPVQAPLPNDQWRLEVASWFNVALARLQGEIVEYATGPLSVSTEGRMFRENGTTDKAMCTQQKVRDPTGYTNFNIFGIVIMFVVGSIIIVISWVLEPLVGFLRQRFWKGSDYKRVQWLLNSTLQLQRIAFETTGLGGPWLRVGKTVPITREKHDLGEMYEYMDASDRHLRFILRKASTEDELTSPNTPRSDNTSRTMVAAMEDSRLFRLPSKI
ncbi:MAG: hypothetical protein M1823_003780 [Watsoniomyces obsoletus]|nr:MAG: hypothetical protein M1823_003780 [Watsoniomyces obsoletus]